jgi:hypothetical protein
MSEWILCYCVIGLIVNLLTMINAEIRECFFEFGVIGFFLQLVISILFFPWIAFVMLGEFIDAKINT